MSDAILNCLKSTEEETLVFIQSVDKKELNKLDNGKSLLLLILEMYAFFFNY